MNDYDKHDPERHGMTLVKVLLVGGGKRSLLQGSLKAKQDPVGLLGTKPFCVPHFLITGNRLHLASTIFPEFQ